jgi:hypothetical protein
MFSNHRNNCKFVAHFFLACAMFEFVIKLFYVEQFHENIFQSLGEFQPKLKNSLKGCATVVDCTVRTKTQDLDHTHGGVSFRRMSVHRLPFGLMSFRRMSVHRLPFGKMSVHRMTVHRLPFGQMCFRRKAVRRLPFGLMSFRRMSVHRLPFGQISFRRVTELHFYEWHVMNCFSLKCHFID